MLEVEALSIAHSPLLQPWIVFGDFSVNDVHEVKTPSFPSIKVSMCAESKR